jgi:hypothetical protein
MINGCDDKAGISQRLYSVMMRAEPCAPTVGENNQRKLRSRCLLIIRDMMFGNRRHFRELLNKSEEGISSNILSDRLKTLLDEGIITRADDPTHKQKGI